MQLPPDVDMIKQIKDIFMKSWNQEQLLLKSNLRRESTWPIDLIDSDAKRMEWASYATFVSQWEIDNYLDILKDLGLLDDKHYSVTFNGGLVQRNNRTIFSHFLYPFRQKTSASQRRLHENRAVPTL